jgi:hypothetical protein
VSLGIFLQSFNYLPHVSFVIYPFSMSIGVRSFNSQMDIHSFCFSLRTRSGSCSFHFFYAQWKLYPVLPLTKIMQLQHADNQNLSGHYLLTNPTTFVNKSDSRKHSFFILYDSRSIKNPHKFLISELYFAKFSGTSPFLLVPNPCDHGL